MTPGRRPVTGWRGGNAQSPAKLPLMSLNLARASPAAAAGPLPLAAEESRRRLELLLVKLTVAIAPLLLVNWLLVPSRAPLPALASQLIIPVYAALALGAARFRPVLLTRAWFELLLFALQATLIFVQIWAYDRPGSPLWLAFLPGVLAGAARWQLPGVWISLAWFYLDRVITLIGFPRLSPRQLAQELTLELAVMTVVGVLFSFLFGQLELHRRRLRASAASLAAVLENVGEAILTIDDADLVDAANLAAGELFGCEPSGLIGGPIDRLLPTYSATPLQLARHAKSSQRGEAQGLRRDGTSFHAEVVTSLIVGDGGPIRILVLRDITELRAQTAALSHQALHDGLTGLPNRLQFTQALLDRIALSRKNAAPLSVLVMDLDNFKEVNDTRGHPVGDLLLQAVAQRLKGQLREGDLVARLGGDEFAVLPAPGAAPGSATTIAEKILGVLSEPFSVDDAVVETGISIGIASYPEHGEDAESLMRYADAAMYAAKRAGGGWATAAGPHPAERSTTEGAVAPADLRRAVEDGELTLHCEPVMSLQDNALQGVDARVRWHHPELGVLEPDQFMPLAERSGVIRPLIRCAARLAVEQMAAWRKSGSEVHVSLRISERNLRDAHLVSTIAGLLHERGLPAGSLTLLASQDTTLAPGAAAFFAAASRSGLRLAIDDYGSGSVSLLHLRSMPFTEIRLAAALTRGLASGPDGAAIVQAIIALAHALGVTVTAKGVGDEATLVLLQELGCDAVTFRKWSRPLPRDSLGAAINSADLQAVLTGSRQMAPDPALGGPSAGAEPG